MIPLQPTFRGWFLIGISIITFCISVAKPSIPSSFIASVCIGLVLSSFILSWFSLYGIEIRRDLSLDGILNEKIYLPLTIKNNTESRKQSVVLREKFDFSRTLDFEFAITPLESFEERIFERNILADKRGKFNLKKVELTGGDPAGLFRRTKIFNLPGNLTIYPRIEKISNLDLKTKTRVCSTASNRPIGITGQGQDVFGLREYRHGDPVRFVNWKATSRQKKIIIKEFEAQELNRISVLLDVDERYVGNDKYDNNFEYLVKTSSSIIYYLSGMYCHTSFITSFGKDEKVYFEDESAYNISPAVDNLLAELQPGKMSMEKLLESSIDIIPGDSILYCLSMSAGENLYTYFDRLSEKGIDIRWLFAPPECFPQNIRGLIQKDQDTSLFGYGMHSPTPCIIKRGQELDDALAGG